MLRVGLTGGIGAGKTLACKTFSSLGVPVIDADEIAHELSAPGKPELKAIHKAFGEEILDSRGRLRRNRLRQIVFSDQGEKERLEKILHPAIKREMQDIIASLRAHYCVVCVPLLIESNMLDLADMVVVIDCPETAQIKRVMRRDRLEEATVLRIIASQASREERLAKADIVIDGGDENLLRERVKSLHGQLMRRAIPDNNE